MVSGTFLNILKNHFVNSLLDRDSPMRIAVTPAVMKLGETIGHPIGVACRAEGTNLADF